MVIWPGWCRLVPLLEEYYDPMYRYQLAKKAEKVVFRGEWAEVAEWVKTYACGY